MTEDMPISDDWPDCPRCDGCMPVLALVKPADGDCVAQPAVCATCKGTKRVSPEHLTRLHFGERMRKARIERGETLFEAAKNQGTTPRQLSDLEHGRIEEA